MKYCIAVQETLRREIVVEAGSLEDALDLSLIHIYRKRE